LAGRRFWSASDLRLAAPILTAVLALAPVFAQAETAAAPATGDVVTTGAGAPASPLQQWLDDAPPASVDGSGDAIEQIGRDDRKMHGEVGFTAGSGGLVGGYAAVSMPVGTDSRVAVAASDYQGGKPWRYHERSLALDVSIGSGHGASADCGRTLRVDGRNVQPLWVSNFDHDALADIDPRCQAAVPPAHP
jgi:hypothetical protein